MIPWRDDEWEIVTACHKLPHAESWSNHGLRYTPTLCDDCRKIIEDMKGKRNDDRGTQSGTER